MAIAVDVANLGTGNNDSGAGQILQITTSNTAAAGSRIIIVVEWEGDATNDAILSASGGGLTWSIDRNVRPDDSSGGGVRGGLVSAYAPAGLAASTVCQVTFVPAFGAQGIVGGASSFLGIATSNYVDGTSPGVVAAATQAWATQSMAISAGSLLIGGCHATAGISNTSSLPSIEAWELDNVPNNYAGVGVYRIESSAGSYTLTGSWGTSTFNTPIAAAYLAAPATAVQVPVVRHALGGGRW